MSGQRCDDCGRSNWDRDARRDVEGFGSAITQTGESRVYCADCRYRRGSAYVFDARSWKEIQAEVIADAACPVCKRPTKRPGARCELCRVVAA